MFQQSGAIGKERLSNRQRRKDSTISREDLDDAIANGIKLAFKEQQRTLDLVVTSAVLSAMRIGVCLFSFSSLPLLLLLCCLLSGS